MATLIRFISFFPLLTQIEMMEVLVYDTNYFRDETYPRRKVPQIETVVLHALTSRFNPISFMERFCKWLADSPAVVSLRSLSLIYVACNPGSEQLAAQNLLDKAGESLNTFIVLPMSMNGASDSAFLDLSRVSSLKFLSIIRINCLRSVVAVLETITSKSLTTLHIELDISSDPDAQGSDEVWKQLDAVLSKPNFRSLEKVKMTWKMKFSNPSQPQGLTHEDESGKEGSSHSGGESLDEGVDQIRETVANPEDEVVAAHGIMDTLRLDDELEASQVVGEELKSAISRPLSDSSVREELGLQEDGQLEDLSPHEDDGTTSEVLNGPEQTPLEEDPQNTSDSGRDESDGLQVVDFRVLLAHLLPNLSKSGILHLIIMTEPESS